MKTSFSIGKGPEGHASQSNRKDLAPRQTGAFTLVEILVTMALLTTMVVGLLMVFNQTQRAFRSGLGQTDVLEGGRGAMEMLVRDLEQMTPCEAPDLSGIPMFNFWTWLDKQFPNPTIQYVLPPVSPSTQPLLRTNVIQQFFFLSKLNQDWTVHCYRVEPDCTGSAVGSLYHYTTNWPRYLPLSVGNSLYRTLCMGSPTFPLLSSFDRSRVADGIVHLHLRAFDTNGVPLTYSYYFGDRNLAAGVNPLRPSLTNATSQGWSFVAGVQPDQMDYLFWNNATPAYVELELGILESKALQHYRAIDPTTPAAQNYLSNHVGQVHLFRQRIPIRNVDFSAYQ